MGFSQVFSFDPGKAPKDTYAMVETCADGWWYSAVLPQDRMVMACMTDTDLALPERVG